MKLSELREKTTAELETEMANCIESLYKLRFRKVTDVIEDPSEISKTRKQIARIRTIIRARDIRKERPPSEDVAAT
jgi:large subunit ribosomal protein L29